MANWSARIPGGFIDLLTRLRIAHSQPFPFDLIGNVVPVAIVDPSPLTIVTVPQDWDIPASAGALAAPAANTLLADTGALAVGIWDFLIVISDNDTGAQSRIAVQRRNAANAANIWEQQFGVAGGIDKHIVWNVGLSIAAGERIRVITVAAAGAGSTYHANIFSRIR